MKTRFAPSPTGYVHLGNIRTALFNALYAHSKQGTFLVRIEDTDLARSHNDYVEALFEDMAWLGIQNDEGPHHDHGFGPYFQSKRADIYAKYYEELEHKGMAFPCFCTEEQLALNRKVQQSAGLPPRYSGTCRNLSEALVKQNFQSGKTATLRFKVPTGKTIEFNDLVRGVQRFNSNDIGDFIIRRADGTSSFLFSNAIDDALMQVTHAMRGEDHVANTPRQILIQQALDLSSPMYGHLPLIVSSDSSPLSKRLGSWSVREMRNLGYLPIAIINYLARLGHNYESNELMPIEELAKHFSIDALGRAPAHFDGQQLLHWQREAIAKADLAKLKEWLLPAIQDKIAIEHEDAFIALISHNCVFPADATAWANRLCADEVNYEEECAEIVKNTPAEFFASAIEAVNDQGIQYTAFMDALKQKTTLKGKQLFQPLRVALTGVLHGPELADIMGFLGKERIINRLEQAKNREF
jgi:glutamyl-tRNA synthetase